MRYIDLLKIKKTVFTPQDVSKALGITAASALVTCSRYFKKGLLIRLKKNYYSVRDKWEALSEEELFRAANILQVRSYISLTTALAYYNITTQVQRDFYESICLKRTKEVVQGGKTFTFTKISKKLYNGFLRKEGFFLATPEKALADAVYLAAIGRYSIDMEAIDMTKLDKKKLAKITAQFPGAVKKFWRDHVGPA